MFSSAQTIIHTSARGEAASPSMTKKSVFRGDSQYELPFRTSLTKYSKDAGHLCYRLYQRHGSLNRFSSSSNLGNYAICIIGIINNSERL